MNYWETKIVIRLQEKQCFCDLNVLFIGKVNLETRMVSHSHPNVFGYMLFFQTWCRF